MAIVVTHAKKSWRQHHAARHFRAYTQGQRMHGERIHTKRQMVTVAFAKADGHDGGVVLACAESTRVERLKLCGLHGFLPVRYLRLAGTVEPATGRQRQSHDDERNQCGDRSQGVNRRCGDGGGQALQLQRQRIDIANGL